VRRAAVIVNAVKAAEPTFREHVEKSLSTAGWSTSLWLETTVQDPGAGMAEAAVADEVDLVVVCGGDGTLMACLGPLAGSGIPVAVVPLGSGNLLARNLGVPIGVDDGLAVAVDGDDRRIDLGRVDDGRPFAVMAGIGFDAAMMAGTTEEMKRLAGWPAYVSSGFRHLRDPMMRVQLSIDSGPPTLLSARTVLVGNVGRLQGGLELLPDAAADDGLLDVVVVGPRTLVDWIRLVWRVFRRDRRQDLHLRRFRGCSIRIEVDRITPRQMDGEVIGEGRSLNAQVDAGALIIRVPRRAAAAA
jgi:diacylglycerol kinase (ATP)